MPENKCEINLANKFETNVCIYSTEACWMIRSCCVWIVRFSTEDNCTIVNFDFFRNLFRILSIDSQTFNDRTNRCISSYILVKWKCVQNIYIVGWNKIGCTRRAADMRFYRFANIDRRIPCIRLCFHLIRIDNRNNSMRPEHYIGTR